VNGPVTWAAFGSLAERVARLEEHQLTASKRADRTWLIVVTVTTALVCPLVVAALLTVLHLASQ
jgi:hypothetical protein